MALTMNYLQNHKNMDKCLEEYTEALEVVLDSIDSSTSSNMKAHYLLFDLDHHQIHLHMVVERVEAALYIQAQLRADMHLATIKHIRIEVVMEMEGASMKKIEF